MRRWWKIECIGKHWKVTLLWYHPGLWLEVFRTMREGGCSVLGSVYYSLKLILVLAKSKK